MFIFLTQPQCFSSLQCLKVFVWSDQIVPCLFISPVFSLFISPATYPVNLFFSYLFSQVSCSHTSWTSWTGWERICVSDIYLSNDKYKRHSKAICYFHPLVERGEDRFVGFLEIWKRSLCRVSLCFDTVTSSSSPTVQDGNSGLQIQNWLCETTRGWCRLICEDSGFWRSEIW